MILLFYIISFFGVIADDITISALTSEL